MRKKIFLGSSRSCIASFVFSQKQSTRWLVFLPEAAADFLDATGIDLKSNLGVELASKMNYLVVNRPGVGPTGLNQIMFEASFRRQKRIRDSLYVMETVVPPNDEIILVGYSEGAYLAPQIAVLDERVKAVIMIGGGTRGWLKEELSNAGPLERKGMRRKISEIVKHPRSNKRWNAFSYATWCSYKDDNTLQALQKLTVPAIAILGSRDRTIDFKTTLADLKKLSETKSVKICVFSNCGHSFVSHWADAWHAVRHFLHQVRLD